MFFHFIEHVWQLVIHVTIDMIKIVIDFRLHSIIFLLCLLGAIVRYANSLENVVLLNCCRHEVG